MVPRFFYVHTLMGTIYLFTNLNILWYMNWLWIILIVAVVGEIIGFINNGKEGAVEGGLGAAFGCGSVILQIFLSVLSIALVIALFGWLFKGCS